MATGYHRMMRLDSFPPTSRSSHSTEATRHDGLAIPEALRRGQWRNHLLATRHSAVCAFAASTTLRLIETHDCRGRVSAMTEGRWCQRCSSLRNASWSVATDNGSDFTIDQQRLLNLVHCSSSGLAHGSRLQLPPTRPPTLRHPAHPQLDLVRSLVQHRRPDLAGGHGFLIGFAEQCKQIFAPVRLAAAPIFLEPLRWYGYRHSPWVQQRVHARAPALSSRRMK